MRIVITDSRANGWQYLAPSAFEVEAIMPGQGDENNIGHWDIVVNYCTRGLKRISNLHRSYMPLLYVLLFPNEEDGRYPHIPLLRPHSTHNNEDENEATNIDKYV